MNRFEARHPDLAERVAAWHAEHPGGTLYAAVKNLGLWPDPADRDAQWFVWRYLPEAARLVQMPGDPSQHPMRDKVAATVRSRILDGTYPPGSRLPARKLLASEHGCSVQPVTHAYSLLQAEGLVSSGGHHKGYLVSAPEQAAR